MCFMANGHFIWLPQEIENLAPAGKEDHVAHQQGKRTHLSTNRERSPFWACLLSGLVKRHRTCSIGGSDNMQLKYMYLFYRPRWLSWMRRPTGNQEVAGSTLAEVGNILSWRLIMKYFLRSFSHFCWFKKGSCQFLAKECAQYWLTTLRTKPAQ